VVRPEDSWSSLSEQTVVSGSANDLPGRAGAPTKAPPRRGRAPAARPAVPGAVGERTLRASAPSATRPRPKSPARTAGAGGGSARASSRRASVAVGESLVALHEWTRQLGPGFVVGIGNGLILGYLMYTSRLVPRAMAVLGLIGGPLIIVSGVAVLLGVIEADSVWQVAVIPEFLWELLLGIWPLVRGFNPSAIARLEHESQ